MKTIKTGPENWKECVGVIVAGLEIGTPKGKDLAREELRKMAGAADEAIKLERALKVIWDSKVLGDWAMPATPQGDAYGALLTIAKRRGWK